MSDPQARALVWPPERLAEAFAALLEHTELSARGATGLALPMITNAGGQQAKEQAIDDWLRSAAPWAGVEAPRFLLEYRGFDGVLERCGPALLLVGGGGEGGPAGTLALLGAKRGRLSIVAPSGEVLTATAEAIRKLHFVEHEAAAARVLDELCRRGELPPVRMAGALTRLREDLAEEQWMTGWMLRPSPSGAWWRDVWRAGVPYRFLVLMSLQLLMLLITVLAWWVLGFGAISGSIDAGWLAGWALLSITDVGAGIIGARIETNIRLRVSGLIKARLIRGAQQVDLDQLRRLGTGEILARAYETETFESLALAGGFQALEVPFLLIGLPAIFHLASLSISQTILYFICIFLIVGASLVSYRTRMSWTDSRVSMTRDLLERMLGHRTRLAQQPRERWHDGEDEYLSSYLERSRRFDLTGMILPWIPRAWMLSGLVMLVPLIDAGADQLTIAKQLGAVLLASAGLGRMISAIGVYTGISAAWKQVALLFRSEQPPLPKSGPEALSAVKSARPSERAPVLEAEGLDYRYPSNATLALSSADFCAREGDRILIEGPSGGGKSTLAAVLAGLRPQDAGVLLHRGFDTHTLGPEEWRRRVAVVPQFNQNYIFTGSLLFNLLIGCEWPPRSEARAEAEAICHELGLGELLERMPSGLDESIGETGWQLSHGERARVYIARALLQHPEVLILDESFGPLDPETLERALVSVLARSRTLILIAHP